jgi:hypothetical protein
MAQQHKLYVTLGNLLNAMEIFFGCFPQEAMLLSDACKDLQENIACLSRSNPNVAGFRSFSLRKEVCKIPGPKVPASIKKFIAMRGHAHKLRVSTGSYLASVKRAREFARNVKVLSVTLSSNHNYSLEPFTAVTTLNVTSMSRFPVHLDQMGLSKLTELTNLKLVKLPLAEINTLDALVEAPRLQKLDLSLNYRVKDVSALSAHVHLVSLNLSATAIKDLQPLSGLVLLEKLSLSDTNVRDLSPLRGLTRLQILSLYRTPVTNLDPISKLSSLTDLDCSNCAVLENVELNGLVNLRRLSLDSTMVRQLTGICDLPNLYRLNAFFMELTTLRPLLRLKKLAMLTLMCTICDTDEATTNEDIRALARQPAMKYMIKPDGKENCICAL